MAAVSCMDGTLASVASDQFSKLSWDSLRIVKAIGGSGSLAPAAASLGINTTTVARRLDQIEQALGVVLFDRRRTGYVPTPSGVEVISLAERVELDVVSVARRLSDSALGHSGELRIATSDALLADFLTPVIAQFQAKNPSIRIEVFVGNAPLNLARGEADIAFRATTTPPENLFGRKIATIAWAAYGRRCDFLDGRPGPQILYQLRWAQYGTGLSALKAFPFIEARVPPERIVYRADSIAAVATAIAAGIGVGLLPCMHADLAPGLVRIGDIEPELRSELWILTHPDIRKSGRVHAFMTHCAVTLGRQRAFVEGHDRHADSSPQKNLIQCRDASNGASAEAILRSCHSHGASAAPTS